MLSVLDSIEEEKDDEEQRRPAGTVRGIIGKMEGTFTVAWQYFTASIGEVTRTYITPALCDTSRMALLSNTCAGSNLFYTAVSRSWAYIWVAFSDPRLYTTGRSSYASLVCFIASN